MEFGFPFSYEFVKSTLVFSETKQFFEENKKKVEEIQKLAWIYHGLWKLIPESLETLFSGHSFPYMDSWEELQVSFLLCAQGLYKQSFISLRNAMELALVCIYFNIDDSGHIRIKDWLKSKDTFQANTPRTDNLWKVLLSNTNINAYDTEHEIRKRYNKLSYLSNYVHSKGVRYSNSIGGLKSNFQTFEEKALDNWITAFSEVVKIVTIIYLLRYPIGMVKYNWSIKCGIDNPFPVLEEGQIEKIEQVLDFKEIETLRRISLQDKETNEIMNYIEALPDMDDEDIEEQIIRLDKLEIQGGIGFIEWEKREKEQMLQYSEETKIKIESRISKIREWALENNYMESRLFEFRK